MSPAKKKTSKKSKKYTLTVMPPVGGVTLDLQPFGDRWKVRKGRLSRTPPQSSGQLGMMFDSAVALSLAAMLGGVPVLEPARNSLVPPDPNCVEKGNVLLIGGVRPQNFDVVYRPDGVRFAFDSKTLNDTASVNKNYQNMINDLATEATTVHSRFPYALVAFIVVIPRPCLKPLQEAALLGTLERLARRGATDDPVQQAEAIALVLWDPETGSIDPTTPSADSPLRIESFSQQIERIYLARYKGLPPHVGVGKEAEKAEQEKPGEA